MKFFLHCLFLIAALFFSASYTYSLAQPRPEKWATPLSKPGLSNFFKVSDQLYRGAQPKTKGIMELKKLGIKTIFNLEVFHSDRSKIKRSKTGLIYEHLYVNTLNIKDEEIAAFLKTATNPQKAPVFLHCYHGSDRTGTFSAAYRIVVQGWSKEEAIEEFVNGGFGYHKMFSNLIQYLKNMDVEKIKKLMAENQ